ncbi:uncharacterized protein LOC128627299 [Artibeus jamaicensis]|uniref:uncharacterized protein LOC128627299 n=1 Tax=Artibeus jamaicensis TaxID=9417 RepID=UPI00235AF940|nr:uncharacterized protein LOC128627299 [Artibeus jamaicensis]
MLNPLYSALPGSPGSPRGHRAGAPSRPTQARPHFSSPGGGNNNKRREPAAAPPRRAAAQAPELPGLREAKWAKNPTPAQMPSKPSPYTPTLTHTHAQKRKTSWLHERGREAQGKRLGQLPLLQPPLLPPPPLLTTPVPATPTATTAGAAAGAGATAAASSSTGLEMGGTLNPQQPL